ncbi:Double-strand break repair protein MRE11, partial [Pseudolycoriella hygida]
MSSSTDERRGENTLHILVATDIHLGVYEKDPIRGNDSFIAFEEILQHAVHNDVDFILLAGDLFHVANPSMNTLQKCMQLLRAYTLGDKEIPFEIQSDQSVNFNAINETANFENPDMNIKFPVFSIHGNHDDPSGKLFRLIDVFYYSKQTTLGFGRLSSLDLLATSGLVNYFGKWTDLSQVDIDPILIRKGETQLAMYGLSHIHDNRLARLFYDKKVVLKAPDESTGRWFNLFVLHQNRADRGIKNFIDENTLPSSIDLIIWGHEHDCRIDPELNLKQKYHVSQPGSSVATSLSEGESIDKHVGLLHIHGNEFVMKSIRLNSVRPFIFDTVHLREVEEEQGFNEGNTSEKVQEYVAMKVNDMIKLAKDKETDHPNQPKLPLIRLRVFYNDEDQLFNAIRFGQQFHTKVANPLDMILLKRDIPRQKSELKPLDPTAMRRAAQVDEDEQNKVEDIVEKYFENADASNSQLKIIPTKAFTELCRRLVLHDDDDAAEKIINFYRDKACSFLNENMPLEENIDEALNDYRNQGDMLQSVLNTRGVKKRTTNVSSAMFSSDTTNVPSPLPAATTRGRGARGGRGSRGGRGGTRGASSSKADVSTTKTNNKATQPSVAPLFSTNTSIRSQTNAPTRTSQRSAGRQGGVTQYIDDSDSE